MALPPFITRRALLQHLGLTMGAGSLASLTGLRTFAGLAVPRPAYGGALGQEPIVRTLLGDISPDALPRGAVLFHEHLSMHFPLGATSHFTDDVDLMIEEVRAARAEGIAAIVDGGHGDMSRNMDALRRIATESGVPVIASGGYYMERSYPADLGAKSADQIADELIQEATRERHGAFGEIGQQGGELTVTERKVFAAVGQASARTGLPVFTHNAYSIRATTVPRDAAIRQLDILEAQGANLGNVCIGHVCCLDDPAAEIAIRIARRGAFVGFDRVGLNGTMPDANRVAMALAIVNAGQANRLLLSSDFYSAQALKRNGGAGLALTATRFGPMLLEAGLPEVTLRSILEDNPRRFLAFVPKE